MDRYQDKPVVFATNIYSCIHDFHIQETSSTIKVLYISSLTKNTTEDDIRSTFSIYGLIIGIDLSICPYTGNCEGDCFLQFADPRCVDEAVKCKKLIKGRLPQLNPIPCRKIKTSSHTHENNYYKIEQAPYLSNPKIDNTMNHFCDSTHLKFIELRDKMDMINKKLDNTLPKLNVLTEVKEVDCKKDKESRKKWFKW